MYQFQILPMLQLPIAAINVLVLIYENETLTQCANHNKCIKYILQLLHTEIHFNSRHQQHN